MDVHWNVPRGVVGQGALRGRLIANRGVVDNPGSTDEICRTPQPVTGQQVTFRSVRPGLFAPSLPGDFLFAGASALLLLCANLFPDFWLVSSLALFPLLYRIIAAGPVRAMRLGFLFGLSFLGVSLSNLFPAAPLTSFFRICCGTTLFALFGWAVAWGRRRFGFNPLVIALLWIALELGVIRLGFSHGLLAEGRVTQPAFGGMAALFGFLSISFLIVFLNSILICAIETIASLAPVPVSVNSRGKNRWDLAFLPGPVAFRLFLVPESRGPPGR